MSRFLMSAWPFPGHVYPQIAVAQALRDAGHEVAFFTGPAMRDTIEGEGFELHPFRTIGEPWAPIHRMERRLPSRPGLLRTETTALRRWLLHSIPAQVADLEPVIDDWRPDVIVSEPALLGPVVILGEKLELPVALQATFLGPLIPGPDAPPLFGFGLRPPRTRAGRALGGAACKALDLLSAGFRRRIDRLRAEHGLGPLGCTVNEHTARMPLYLVGSVPELDYGRADLPPTVHYVGRCTWQAPSDPATSAWLDRLPTGRRWVHVTEGTSAMGEPYLLRAAVEALAGLDVEVVMTTGRRGRQVELGSLPANVHVTEFVRHDDLLPRCAAMVAGGGAGAVIAGLSAGVPMAIAPVKWDQPDNARRVAEAGAGLSLNASRITPARLRAAVRLLLDDPRYAAAARRLSRQLAAAGGPRRAAELLARLAVTGGPVHETREDRLLAHVEEVG